jgi:hypothetical protein
MLNTKKIIAFALIITIIVTVFVVTSFGVPDEASSEPKLTILDVTKQFLSEVVGLDMSKYTLAPPPSGYEKLNISTNPYKTIIDVADSEFEGSGFDFVSSEGTLHGMMIFRYGQLASVKFDPENLICTEAPAAEIKDQALIILQRYQTYLTKNYNVDGSFLVRMQEILKTVNELSVTNTTYDNINFQVSENGDKTCIKWIYTANGIIADYKRVELNFENNVFTAFTDMWSIYKIGPVVGVSFDEAYKIAREAAEKEEYRIVNEEGVVVQTFNVPDLSNKPYNYYFFMTPYQNSSSPSNSSREAATLYPFWQFNFYFNQCFGRYGGVQVGLWGDTKEVSYTSGILEPYWPSIQTPKPDSGQ